MAKDWSNGRVCKRCNEHKPLSEYHVRNKTPYTECKTCFKIYLKERQAVRPVLPDDAERTCAKCQEAKRITEFGRNLQSAGGYLNLCKRCYSNKYAERKWGISDILDKIEGALCEICEEPLGPNAYAVDHDHSCCPKLKSCGKCIRGLLCPMCNHGLGSFRDRPELMLKAIDYLRNHNEVS